MNDLIEQRNSEGVLAKALAIDVDVVTKLLNDEVEHRNTEGVLATALADDHHWYLNKIPQVLTNLTN